MINGGVYPKVDTVLVESGVLGDRHRVVVAHQRALCKGKGLG